MNRKSKKPRSFGSSIDSEDDSDFDYVPDNSSPSSKSQPQTKAPRKKRKKIAAGDGKKPATAPTTCANSASVDITPSIRQASAPHLPEELWVRIFEEVIELEGGCVPVLIRIRRVCRLWYNVIGETQSLWRNATIQFPVRGHLKVQAAGVSEVFLDWLARTYLVNTYHLDVTSVRGRAKLGAVLGHCKQLTGLAVATGDAFANVDPHPTTLSHLTVCSCTPSSLAKIVTDSVTSVVHLSLTASTTNNGMRFPVCALPQLRVLFLEAFEVSLIALSGICPSLKDLTLYNCIITDLDFSVGQAGLPQLTSCRLVDCDYHAVMRHSLATVWENDNPLAWISKCPRLECLAMSGRSQLWAHLDTHAVSDSARGQVQTAPLKHLSLASSRGSGDQIRRSARGGGEQVRIRHLLEALLACSSASLEHLQLNHIALDEYLDSIPVGTELPAVRTLHLEYCSLDASQCLRMLSLCPRVTSVHVEGNYGLPRGAKQTFRAGGLERLRSLLVDGSTGD